jgi:hypothetical protein
VTLERILYYNYLIHYYVFCCWFTYPPDEPKIAQLLKISQSFMETETSLSCSEEPAAGRYREPDESGPYDFNLFL